MALLNPYLSFDNNLCREAMNFYRDCFGGDLVLQKVSEMPEMAAQMPPEFKDSILHSTLTSGKLVIMASDLNRSKPIEGNTYSSCVNCETEEEINRLFSKFSAGAKAVEPLKDMPWGAIYGEITDKYGKVWVFNCPKG